MADVKWIKLATQIFDNRKIKQIEKMPDGDSVLVIWFKILCLAGTVNDGGLVYFTKEMPYTDEMLSTEFGRPIQTVRLALSLFQQFKMMEIIDNIFYISSWEKYQNIEGLDKIREQNRIRKQKERNRKNIEMSHDVTQECHANVTQCHATDIDIDIDIDKDKDKNIVQNDRTGQATKNDIDNFFEQIWKLYPNKKGKGQISDSKKKILYQVGIENMTVAIDRYKAELKKDDWRKQQNGSTFFHSGYIDYLDGNYEPSKGSKNNSFGIDNQNEYNFAELEKELQSTGGN